MSLSRILHHSQIFTTLQNRISKSTLSDFDSVWPLPERGDRNRRWAEKGRQIGYL